MPVRQHHLFGMSFISGALPEIRSMIYSLVSDRQCKVVVTPNVDHFIRLEKADDRAILHAYNTADLRVCDSRIVAFLGRFLFDENIIACPGADIVHSLLVDRGPITGAFLVFGPDEQDFSTLKARFPNVPFVYVEAPQGLRQGTPAWDRSLEAIEAVDWDVGLICISFPKQEIFASALRDRGVANGTLLCVGASVDFLTGRQRRAPIAIQRLGLEWLFRMLTNPTRLLRRYGEGFPNLMFLIIRQIQRRKQGRAGRRL